jgi:hypothetical protein
MHKCATDLEWGMMDGLDEVDPETKFLRRFYKETLWNASGCILINPHHTAFLTLIIRLAGLDPKSATLQEMDALDPIFECVFCNSFIKGRATMTWKGAVCPSFIFLSCIVLVLLMVILLVTQACPPILSRLTTSSLRYSRS